MAAQATPSEQRATPPRLLWNFTNLGRTCYASTVAQVLYGNPYIRNFVSSPTRFKFVQNGQFCFLVRCLRSIFQELDEGGRRLPPNDTGYLVQQIDWLENEYGPMEALDATEVFEQVLDMLVRTSSATPAGEESTRPLGQLAAELERTQRPLRDDAECSWSDFKHNGHETLLVEYLYHQIVRERVCTSCGFIKRVFHELATVVIQPPDGLLSPPEKRYDLRDLLREYVLGTATEEAVDKASHCPFSTCNSALGPRRNRIVKARQVLSFTFRRVHWDNNGQEQRWLNHVEVPERLNLAEYVDDVSLPSERKPTAPGRTPMRWITHELTEYTLQATIHYRATEAHYVAYVRHGDRWIRFDDLKESPEECSPWGRSGETAYVAVYLKSRPQPPLQPPAQTGKKHQEPGTSDSTASERNQRQGFPTAESPSISDSRPGATTPAEQSRHTKTKANERSNKALFRKIKAQILPVRTDQDLARNLKQVQGDVADIKKQLGQLQEAVVRIEKQVLQNANALENERRVRQEIAAEEAKIAAGKAKIADLEAKLANSRK